MKKKTSRSRKAPPAKSPSFYDFSVLRDLRKKHGMTIAEVSQKSGISPAVISKLERNRSKAELDTLFKLGRVFSINPSEVLRLAESPTAHRAGETGHSTGGFHFREVRYGNASCYLGSAKKGAEVNRPAVHHDNYEICWVLKGSLRFELSNETLTLKAGEAIQFDALLTHSYTALEDVELILIHLRKDKRF